MAFVWSTVILTLVVILEAVTCQRIPLRSSDPSLMQLSDAELYVGSKMLPDGVEIASYLQRYVPSRYMLQHTNKHPLNIISVILLLRCYLISFVVVLVERFTQNARRNSSSALVSAPKPARI